MDYQGKHSGGTIDRQIDRVIDGSVVVENADKIAKIIEDNTLSTLDPTSSKPVSSKTIAQLMSGNEALDKLTFALYPFTFEVGTIDTTGKNLASSTRLRSGYTAYTGVVATPAGFVIRAVFYYDSETLVYNHKTDIYSRSAIIGEEGCVARIVIQKDNAEESITLTDLVLPTKIDSLSTIETQLRGDVVTPTVMPVTIEHPGEAINSQGQRYNATAYGVTSPIYVAAGSTLRYRVFAGATTTLAKLNADDAPYTVLQVVTGSVKYHTMYYTAVEDVEVVISGIYLYGYPSIEAVVYPNGVLPITDAVPNKMSYAPIASRVARDMDDTLRNTIGGSSTSYYETSAGFIYGASSSKSGQVNTTSTTYRLTSPIAVKRGDVVRWRAACYDDTAAIAYSANADAEVWMPKVSGITDAASRRGAWVADADGYIRLSFNRAHPFELFIHKRDNLNLLSGYSALDTSGGKRYSPMRMFGEQPAADGSDGSFMDIKADYNTLINNIYEPLREAHPNYITRESAGKDATGTYNQWVYTFEPPYYQQSILLVAGVHANEEDAIAGLARIMQMITNEWHGDEDLEYIRHNVKVTVVPVVNVWGYSQPEKVRTSPEGVSIQSWDSQEPIAEVANLKTIFERLALELAFAVDMHTTTNNSYGDFYAVINKSARNARTLYRTNAWLVNNHDSELPVNEQLIGYLPSTKILSAYLYNELGVQSSTLELSDYHWDNVKASSKVLTVGVTMWLNYIIQQLNDNYKPLEFIPEANYREVKG